ncbi:MAG: PEGA domain-containing protein [Myxococcota bacterium]
MRHLVGVLVASAALAEAPPTRIAILGVEARDLPVSLGLALGDGLRSQAASFGWRLVPARDFVETKLVFCEGSEDTECLVRAGAALGADKLVYGTLRNAGDTIMVTLKMLDVEGARIERTVEDRLPRSEATSQRLVLEAGRWIQELAGDRPRGRLRVTVKPYGAEVMVDGQSGGVAQREPVVIGDVDPGRRLVEVRLDGYELWAETVRVAPRETVEVDVTLVPLKPDVEARLAQGGDTTPGSGWRTALWIGLGATAVAGGAAVWAGLSLRGIEDDRQAAILASREGGDPDAQGYIEASEGDDACAEAEDEAASDVVRACDRGRSRALLTNVLVGVTAAGAAATGFCFWNGWIAADANGDTAAIAVGGRF